MLIKTKKAKSNFTLKNRNKNFFCKKIYVSVDLQQRTKRRACNSDHSLVCCKMHISIRLINKSKETRKVWLDIVAMQDPDWVEKFSALMQPISSCPDMNFLPLSFSLESEKVYTRMPWSPSEKKTHANKDWFEENIKVTGGLSFFL